MDNPDILVLQASYSNPVHAEAIGRVLNHYAQDPMGGGHSLPADLLERGQVGVRRERPEGGEGGEQQRQAAVVVGLGGGSGGIGGSACASAWVKAAACAA